MFPFAYLCILYSIITILSRSSKLKFGALSLRIEIDLLCLFLSSVESKMNRNLDIGFFLTIFLFTLTLLYLFFIAYSESNYWMRNLYRYYKNIWYIDSLKLSKSTSNNSSITFFKNTDAYLLSKALYNSVISV